MPRLVSMVQAKDLVDCWRSRSPPLRSLATEGTQEEKWLRIGELCSGMGSYT